MYYKIYCGYGRQNLSYHDCHSLDVTLVSAHESGNTERYEFSFKDFDKEVFFALRASDGARNVADESNIVTIFVPQGTTTVPPTTTSK